MPALGRCAAAPLSALRPALRGQRAAAATARWSPLAAAAATPSSRRPLAEAKAACTRPYASLATQQAVTRRSRFDLPVERSAPVESRFKLAEPQDGEERRPVRLDRITSEDVWTQWPPKAMIEPAPEVAPVRRPHLWLAEEHPEVGAEDVGRFVKLPRDDLLNLLPEGPCGELARDLTLVPSRTRPVGLMMRKVAFELIMQLSALRDATDRDGQPRIRKSGFLLDGRKGTGKSQILNLLAIWARKNDWLVVMEPTPARYRLEIAEIKRSNNGIYIQNEFAQQFLEATSIANREKLEEIPVDLSVYGSRAIDGECLKATKRLYEPLIEKAVDVEVQNEGLSEVERLKRIAQYRSQVRVPSMAEQLRDPQNVWEIVEFGLDNETYATQAVAELMAQLQVQTTHPVLVIVDQWNECFPVSEYVSIRYDNTRFHGYIPSYHLAMPRAFHRWDGKLFRRGLKVCATSWMRYQRRDYRPELLGVQDYEIKTVRNFSQHEFANYVTYLRMMNVLHNFPREDLEYYYMLTQGNGYQARKVLSTLY